MLDEVLLSFVGIVVAVVVIYGLVMFGTWVEGNKRCTAFEYEVYMYNSRSYCRVDGELMLSSEVIDSHIIQVE